MRQWRRLPPRLRITMNSNWFRLWAALWRGADHPAAYFVLFLSPPAGDYTGIEISTWHERSGLGFRSRRGRDRGWAVSTASAKRSVTGGSDGPPHCKNTRAAVCNIDPDQLARLALLPLSDGCWGSDGAGKTKILKSNDVDKQKASNSVGHRRTICQGMLRRKTWGGGRIDGNLTLRFLFGADRRHRHCLECLPCPHGRGLGWSYVSIVPNDHLSPQKYPKTPR